jgi:hypothetical protein
MFCATGVIFGSTEGVGSSFHVLRSRNHFRRYRGRQFPLKCFTLPDSFSTVLRASYPVGTHFLRYRGCRGPFSCFALPDSFSAVPRASVHAFMFCAPGLIFNDSEPIGSRFHVLRSHTHFRRYRGRRFSFSCFALSDSFSAVPRAFDPVFMFCAPGLVVDGTEGVRSRFHVLRSRTHFLRYRGRQIPFSCFTLSDSLSAVPSASGLVFMFCAPELVFGDTEGVGTRFHVLRAGTGFRRYRGRPIPFSCFALTDRYSAVPRASDPVFMFCAP